MNVGRTSSPANIVTQCSWYRHVRKYRQMDASHMIHVHGSELTTKCREFYIAPVFNQCVFKHIYSSASQCVLMPGIPYNDISWRPMVAVFLVITHGRQATPLRWLQMSWCHLGTMPLATLSIRIESLGGRQSRGFIAIDRFVFSWC